MKAQSKLSLIIKSLSNKDKKSLDLFLQSSYFNKKNQLVLLWKLLSSDPDLSNEALFNHIFPRKKFQDLKVRHAKSELLKLIERYISSQGLEGNPELQELICMQYFLDNDLMKHFDYKINFYEEKFSNNAKNIDQLYYEYLRSEIIQQEANKQGRSISMNMQEVSDTLDVFFLATKLKQWV